MYEVRNAWGVWVVLGVLSAANLAFSPVRGAKGTRINRVAYPQLAQVLCPPGCATCSSMNGCVTCQKGLFLFLHRDGMRQTGICVHACPGGYYGLRITRDYRKCQRCSLMHCESCYSSSYCTRCSPPFRVYQGTCTDTCPDDTFYASYTTNCVSQVDCAVGAWSSWGICQRNGQNCGFKYGHQQRNRVVLQQPSDNGYTCPETIDYQECRLQFRECTDISNQSEPVRDSFLDSLMDKWKREREKKRRRRKTRNNRKKKGRPSKDRKKKQKSETTRKNAQHMNKKRTNTRKKQKQRPLLPDVTTNQINVLMDADDFVTIK